MSADAWADKNGKFSIEVRDYKSGRFLGNVVIQALDPFAPVAVEIMDGTDFYPNEQAEAARRK